MTPAEKNTVVLALLRASSVPLSPKDIAIFAAVSESASIHPDSVRRSLARIGAIRHPGGRYSAPAEAQPASQPQTVREPLPAFVCRGCYGRTTDYSGSRASGDGRKCRRCAELGL